MVTREEGLHCLRGDSQAPRTPFSGHLPWNEALATPNLCLPGYVLELRSSHFSFKVKEADPAPAGEEAEPPLGTPPGPLPPPNALTPDLHLKVIQQRLVNSMLFSWSFICCRRT